MTTGKLLWGTTWRGGVWGVLAGGILGAIYGPILIVILTIESALTNTLSSNDVRSIGGLSLFALVVGVIFGAAIGAFAGALNGLLIGILTRLVFSPSNNAARYRLIVAIASALFTGITALLGLLAILLLIMGTTPDPQELILFITLPALIAAIAAALISILITRWYER